MSRFATSSSPYRLVEFYREEFLKHHQCLQQQRPYYSESAITGVEAALAKIIDELDLKGKNDELINELVTLSTKHGILTQYTSYLADENAPAQQLADQIEILDHAAANQRLARSLERVLQACPVGGGRIELGAAGQLSIDAVFKPGQPLSEQVPDLDRVELRMDLKLPGVLVGRRPVAVGAKRAVQGLSGEILERQTRRR